MAMPGQKLIINFRDPRDLLCNIYHWVFQHPVLDKTPAQVAEMRVKVAVGGIDKYVREWGGQGIFHSLRAIETRLKADEPDILKLSYAQICLDFDNVVEKLINFLGVARDAVDWPAVEGERTSNLSQNPRWIGRAWKGTDTMPGRYRHELQPETVAALDQKYGDILKFFRSLEAPAFRHFLATEAIRPAMEAVAVAAGDELFWHDGPSSLSKLAIFQAAAAHRNRDLFGRSLLQYRYIHIVMPDKAVAYGQRPAPDMRFEGLWLPFYRPDLLSPKDGQRFYPRTDSHWNSAGALASLQAALLPAYPAKAAALAGRPWQLYPGRQQGDLGLRLEMPPEPVEMLAPVTRQARLVFTNGLAGSGRVHWYRNPEIQDGSRALVLHDSAGLWGLDALAEMFSELVVIYGDVFDYRLVQALEPNLVLCVQTEHGLAAPPQTGDVRSFVAACERASDDATPWQVFLAADERFAEAAP
jgi:hypothetical protein